MQLLLGPPDKRIIRLGHEVQATGCTRSHDIQVGWQDDGSGLGVLAQESPKPGRSPHTARPDWRKTLAPIVLAGIGKAGAEVIPGGRPANFRFPLNGPGRKIRRDDRH